MTDAPQPQFSKSADNNKQVILEQLQKWLKADHVVLEVASGTGQHALHFCQNLLHINWQPSDRDLDAFGLRERLAGQAVPKNLLPPITLDIAEWDAAAESYDAIYSANCLHVIPENLVTPYVTGVASSLKPGGLMLLYGPFRYGGDFTTPSNRQFDGFLRETYPGGGIRDFETIDQMARNNGLEFQSDTAMPANNQFLVWRKVGRK